MTDTPIPGQTPENPPAAEETPPPAEPPQQGGIGLTFTLIGLLAAIYLLTSYPGFEHIQRWAADFGVFLPVGVADDQWWRWITSNLLHVNLMHLFMNCFAIYIFGTMLEPVLGKVRYLGLLVAGGIGCDLLTYFFSDHVSLGASGIAYGLIGFYFMLVLIVTRRVTPEKFAGSLRTVIFVILLYVGSDIMRPNINIWGHLGGLAGGLVYGLALLSGRPKASA